MPHLFTCARCHRELESAWDDDSAWAESQQYMEHSLVDMDDCVEVCKTCLEAILDEQEPVN